MLDLILWVFGRVLRVRLNELILIERQVDKNRRDWYPP